MQLRVEEIVSVQVRHDYFVSEGFDWNAVWPESYSQSQSLRFIPTKQTQTELENLGCYFKTTPFGFKIFAEVEEISSALHIIKGKAKNTVLQFYALAPDTTWLYKTKLSNTSPKGKIGVYGNSLGFSANGNQYLHNEIENWASGTKEPGKLVRKAGIVYEAINRTSAQPPSGDWEELGTDKEFSSLSSLLSISQSLTIKAPELDGANLAIKDELGQVVFEQTFESGISELSREVNVDFLPEGVYTYFINGSEKETFYNAFSVPNEAVGIVSIQIQNKPSTLAASKKLTEEWLPVANGNGVLNRGEINPRQFYMHFLPQRARWKYIFGKDLNIANEDIPASYNKLSDTLFESKKALPITKKAKGEDFGLEQPLPAATAGILIPQYNGGPEVTNYVREIFINV